MEPLTLAELCERLGVDAKKVRQWRKEGMPAATKGRALQFDPDAVTQWLIDHGKATREPEPEPEEEPEQIATTAAEAAAALGISHDRFNRWVTEPGFPGKPGRPGCREAYFPIEQIRAWRAARYGTGEGNGKADSRMNTLRERKLEIEAQRSELAYERELGKILDLDDMTRYCEFSIATAKSVLDQLADRVDARLPAKLAPKIRARIRAVIERSLKDAYGAIDQMLSKDTDETEDDEDGTDE